MLFSLCSVYLVSPCDTVHFSYYAMNLIQSERSNSLCVSLNFLRGNIISHLRRLILVVYPLTFFFFSIWSVQLRRPHLVLASWDLCSTILSEFLRWPPSPRCTESQCDHQLPVCSSTWHTRQCGGQGSAWKVLSGKDGDPLLTLIIFEWLVVAGINVINDHS